MPRAATTSVIPTAAGRDLGGTWRAAAADDELRRRFPDDDLDDGDWAAVPVPGHWRSAPELAGSDGPVLYRRRFEAAAPGADRRSWLIFDGMFYQGDIWLDGSYLGDTEGYFFPHSFEVTERLTQAREHLLAVELACTPPGDKRAKRSITGVFEHWDCIDPAWNPGGIWAPVTLVETGPVRIARLKVTCRDATEVRATLEVEVELDAREATTALVTTAVAGEASGRVVAERSSEESLAAGPNRVRWQMAIDQPELWWPHALGDQPLHTVTVTVVSSGQDEADEPSDRRSVLTGLRQVRMRNFEAAVNGERLFLKGANLGPTRRALAEATPEELVGDIDMARRAGLDLVRIHAHITRTELYEAADRAGMLVWQDLPLQWGYGRIRKEAVRQAREAVDLLAHHPSLAVWCGHNEPIAVDVAPGATPDRGAAGRYVRGQLLPSLNKTALDRSIKRAIDKADGSRPVVAHSGVWPHPTNGTDAHLYFGWYHGHERDLPRTLARLPILARFVGEFGAQAVPDTAGWAEPERWPDLDWDRLGAHHALQKELLDRHVPSAGQPTFEAWRAATQDYQATVVRYHVETLRRLKYRPAGGFCLFLLADAQPAISWAVLDHARQPKAAFHALAAACAPVVVVADRPAERYAPGSTIALDVHLVNDLRTALEARATAHLRWPSGEATWSWEGSGAADSVSRVGRVRADLPADLGVGGLSLDLAIDWSADDGRVGSWSTRYEAETG